MIVNTGVFEFEFEFQFDFKMQKINCRRLYLVWLVLFFLCAVIGYTYLAGSNRTTLFEFFSFRIEEPTKESLIKEESPKNFKKEKFGTAIKAITDPAQMERILNTSDRTERMTEIIKLLPAQRDWPEDLGLGFNTIKHPIHTVDISPELSVADAENRFYGYLGRYSIKCPRAIRIGGSSEAGWFACYAGPYTLTKPCLVYSLGMGVPSRWVFDMEIMNKYGCADMAFDPTMNKDHHKPYEKMWYHNIGIDGFNGVNERNWTMRTLGTMLENLGHTKSVIDILKMDIEHSEWRALETMFLEGALVNVRQISMEIHTSELRGKKSDSSDFTYYWLIMKGLDRLGFKYWRHDYNYYRSYTSPHTGAKRPILANMNFINANLLLNN